MPHDRDAGTCKVALDALAQTVTHLSQVTPVPHENPILSSMTLNP
jgi:hypothetical protein